MIQIAVSLVLVVIGLVMIMLDTKTGARTHWFSIGLVAFAVGLWHLTGNLENRAVTVDTHERVR